jgi:hypothetical protein
MEASQGIGYVAACALGIAFAGAHHPDRVELLVDAADDPAILTRASEVVRTTAAYPEPTRRTARQLLLEAARRRTHARTLAAAPVAAGVG